MAPCIPKPHRSTCVYMVKPRESQLLYGRYFAYSLVYKEVFLRAMFTILVASIRVRSIQSCLNSSFYTALAVCQILCWLDYIFTALAGLYFSKASTLRWERLSFPRYRVWQGCLSYSKLNSTYWRWSVLDSSGRWPILKSLVDGP